MLIGEIFKQRAAIPAWLSQERISREIKYDVVLSVHGETMYFLSNRIEDTVGDAPQVSFTC